MARSISPKRLTRPTLIQAIRLGKLRRAGSINKNDNLTGKIEKPMLKITHSYLLTGSIPE
jgi:hypothetical protein